jgi:endoglucanase
VAVITAKTSDMSLTCQVTNTAIMHGITATELVSKMKIGSNFAAALDYVDFNRKNGYNDYDNTSSIIGIGFTIREPGKDYVYTDWGTSMLKGDSIHQSIPLNSLVGCDPSLKLSRAVIQSFYRGTSDGKMTMMVSNAKIMVGNTEYKLDYLNGTHNMTMYSLKNAETGIFNCGNSVGDEKESDLPQLSKLVGGKFEADIKIIDINETSRDDKTSYYLTCDGVTSLPSKEMVNSLKEAGYDTVRLTVSWTPHMNDQTFLIDKTWFNKVEEMINWILDNDMYCIINSHYDYLKQSWVGDHWDEAWMLPKYQKYVDERFTAMWNQIAEQFKDYDDYLIFEDMNEPYMSYDAYIANGGNAEVYDKTQADRVNALNGIFYSVVQKSGGNNINRFLMLACVLEKSGYLKYMELPNSNRIVATVHTYYEPFNGGLYSNGTDEAASFNTLVDKDMERISAFTKKTSVPVIIGEFANTEAIVNNERIAQATYLVEKAKEIGVPCMWWECVILAWTPDNTKFGLYNREKMNWEHQDILKSIINSAKVQK